MLLYLDWNGILTAGVPSHTGDTTIASSLPLTFEDGTPIKLDGPAGLWGRAKFAITDWDHDGDWDVLFGTNRSCQRFFSAAFANQESTPFLLRNTGSAEKPIFAPPAPIRLGGETLRFGVHIAAVWPSDMNDDGVEDLLIGAEDGRVYVFMRHELTP